MGAAGWPRLAWFLGLVGCAGQGGGDGAAYVAAALDGELAACNPIADPDLRAECRAFAAAELARNGAVAGAIEACSETGAGPWRDECFFLVADLAELAGEQARSVCEQAGSYRDNCLAHALGRQAQAVLAASPLGEEPQAFAQVEALAVELFGPQRGPSRARSIARKALAARLEGGDLALSHCGAADLALCAEGYAQAVLSAAGGKAGIAPLCAGSPTAAAVRDAGLPAWEEPAADLARAAWADLCQPGRRPLGPGPAATPRRPRRRRARRLLLPLLLPVLLGTACGRPAVQQEGPAHAYLAAVESGEPAACEAVGDPDLRGECVVFAAAAQAEAGRADDARATCEALSEGVWRDECWFTLADALAATGADAKALCDAAGRFQTPCLGHVIARDSRRILGELPVGQEAAAFEALREAATTYVGPRMGTTRARQNMRKALAARFRDGDFDPALCGSAPLDLCRGAYVELVTFAAAHEDRGEEGGAPQASGAWRTRQVCEGPRTLDAVRAQGFPGWVPAGETLAREGWDEICKRQAQPPARHAR